ncbi:hypothetical protein LJC03_04340 [Methanobrevibacter sp. OttesenSCG-928-I08]|nr:hypothetical protein [Methanobrevibacter sp. OttesenSCG-928-I08]
MLLNWCEEISNVDPSINFRSVGGWLKTVNGIDKSVTNGYSIEGEFIKSGDYKEEISNGLYLDCNKEGKKAKPRQDFRLIRVKDGKLTLIDQVYDGKKNWAVDLWDSILSEINPNYKESEAEKVVSNLLNQTGKNIELLKEVNNQIAIKIAEFEKF